MLEPEIVRPTFGRHPRLAIWGPLEARLQRADLLVLGGLNEGTWPPAVETGPWLNRPMRARCGCRNRERRIGLSAHDFVAALGAERVLLTRAEREGGAPTVPSRWLARLDALFGYEPGGKTAPPEYIQRGQHEYLAWADALDRPGDYRPGRVPNRARRSRRGRRGSRSPASNNGGATPTGSMRGASWAWTHSIRSKPSSGRPIAATPCTTRWTNSWPPIRRACCRPARWREFEALGEKHLGTLMTAPAERAFWWPRFQRLTRWFIATENARRQAGTRLLASETTGSLTVGPSSRPLTHRGARRSHRRDRDRRLGRDRLQDRSRADQPGARGAVRTAAAARGGDGRARRLQTRSPARRRKCISPTGRPMAWATAAR